MNSDCIFIVTFTVLFVMSMPVCLFVRSFVCPSVCLYFIIKSLWSFNFCGKLSNDLLKLLSCATNDQFHVPCVFFQVFISCTGGQSVSYMLLSQPSECVYFINDYTSADGSGRRYYILPLKFLSFFLFFSFAAGSPRWLYWQGTFLAQMVGYRCNFKNWVENLGGDPH